HHVAYCRSPEVVRNSARATCSAARSGPSLGESSDGTRLLRTSALRCDHPEEDARYDLPFLLEALVLGVTRFEESAKIVSHREHPALAVLRGLGIQPDLAGLEVDLTPFERE